MPATSPHNWLLPPDLAAKLPRLRGADRDADPLALVKFHQPWAGGDLWAWHVAEYDGADTCFGVVTASALTVGYFQLSKVMRLIDGLTARGTFARLGITAAFGRDDAFEPASISALISRHNARRRFTLDP